MAATVNPQLMRTPWFRIIIMQSDSRSVPTTPHADCMCKYYELQANATDATQRTGGRTDGKQIEENRNAREKEQTLFTGERIRSKKTNRTKHVR